MDYHKLLDSVTDFAQSHAFALTLTLLLTLWKAVPLKTREALEVKYPRTIEFARAIWKLLPDLVGSLTSLRNATKVKPKVEPVSAGTNPEIPID